MQPITITKTLTVQHQNTTFLMASPPRPDRGSDRGPDRCFESRFDRGTNKCPPRSPSPSPSSSSSRSTTRARAVTPNPLRSNPHTSIQTVKSERTNEWARSLTPVPPVDRSEEVDEEEGEVDRWEMREEMREEEAGKGGWRKGHRSRFSQEIEGMVRLTTSPDIVRDMRGGEARSVAGERPWSGNIAWVAEKGLESPGFPSPGFASPGFGRPMSGESQGGLLKVASGGSGEKKTRIRMLTDEERMRKEIEMLEVPTERIGAKRPGGWRWWFGID